MISLSKLALVDVEKIAILFSLQYASVGTEIFE